MKGYVAIDVSDNIKYKIINLRNEILEWKNKPNQEVFTFKKTPWWQYGYEYTFNIPEHLDEYFFDTVFDEDYYCFDTTKIGKDVGKLYHLVMAGNPVHLGEDLARVYNKIKSM